MDEVCKKHNIRLLTYGTLVRIYLLDDLFTVHLIIISAEDSWQTSGWGSPSRKHIRVP